MINPYKSPINDCNKESDSTLKYMYFMPGWKIFFWLLFVLEILTIYMMLTDINTIWYELLMELVVYSIILMGIYGLAYDRRFFSSKFWKITIPIGLIYDTHSVFTDDWGQFSSIQEFYFIAGFTAFVGIPLLTVQYIGLYTYSKR